MAPVRDFGIVEAFHMSLLPVAATWKSAAALNFEKWRRSAETPLRHGDFGL
jgi:hypothetical protein